MKVLQLVTDRDRRGAQVFAMDLARGLEQLGVTVETVALTAGRHGDLLPIESLGPSRRSWRTLRALRERARTHDVVIAHGSSTLFACAVALTCSRTPFVYRQISDPLFWAASWTRRVRVAITIRRAAAIVALADTSRAVLMRHYRLDGRRVRVIPNAVPASGFLAARIDDRSRARQRFGLPATGPVIAYVGALAEEKGVDLVVRCAGEIDESHTLVVGDGLDRAPLELLAERVAAGRVRFSGAIDDAVDAFAAADVVALPSRGGDSMPAVLIEAGLCEIPVVATPVGAITDIVVDGETGIIVPIDDASAFTSAVRRLLTDGDLRAAMGAAAGQRCRVHFTISATAPQWVDLLTSVARRPDPDGRTAG